MESATKIDAAAIEAAVERELLGLLCGISSSPSRTMKNGTPHVVVACGLLCPGDRTRRYGFMLRVGQSTTDVYYACTTLFKLTW